VRACDSIQASVRCTLAEPVIDIETAKPLALIVEISLVAGRG